MLLGMELSGSSSSSLPLSLPSALPLLFPPGLGGTAGDLWEQHFPVIPVESLSLTAREEPLEAAEAPSSFEDRTPESRELLSLPSSLQEFAAASRAPAKNGDLWKEEAFSQVCLYFGVDCGSIEVFISGGLCWACRGRSCTYPINKINLIDFNWGDSLAGDETAAYLSAGSWPDNAAAQGSGP